MFYSLVSNSLLAVLMAYFREFQKTITIFTNAFECCFLLTLEMKRGMCKDHPEAQHANTAVAATQNCLHIVDYLTVSANWICLAIISLQPRAQNVENLYLKTLAEVQVFIITVRIKQARCTVYFNEAKIEMGVQNTK